MERLPTEEELTTLGVALFEDGVEAHAAEVADLVQILNTSAPDDRLVTTLGDAHAPSIIRTRALAKIVARWPDYSNALTSQNPAEFDVALTELLAAWRAHQALRASSSAVGDLYASRLALDRVRDRLRAIRARAREATGRDDAGSPAPSLCADHA